VADRRPKNTTRPPVTPGSDGPDPKPTLQGVSSMRWRPEDQGGPLPAVGPAPPDASEPPDEPTRAAQRGSGFGPDPQSKMGEMVWKTQVSMGPPGNFGGATPEQSRATEAMVPVAPTPVVRSGPPPAAPSMIMDVPPTPTTQVTVYKLERPVEFDKRLVMLRDSDSPAAAAYRVLRYRLQERGNPRVIVVSSPRAREGKTTTAVNLALALGEAGRARVLLIEANLRAPKLAEVLAFMPPVCFSEQVSAHRDQPDEPWTVVEAHSPWLHVAAVKPDQKGRPLIDGPAFAIAVDQLRHAGYDYVVVDTPAVLGAADVNLTQDSADGVLLVVRARQTPGRYLRRALEQLAPAKILGIVMNEAS
jgi:Mrp family chromosome partitioning ATPase